MFVYVKKADLVTDPVPVIAFYPDETLGLKIDAYGSSCTMMYVPAEALKQATVPPVLATNFRSYMHSIVNVEANRRIKIPFPDFMQNNCASDINASIVAYGPDPEQWPADAQDRKIENDRGWAYVHAIRQTSDALSSQTTLTDPTDDSHWPAIIPPVYIGPPGT
jgi:hypothetical protein